MRTTAGSAISTARTAGSATLPPGLVLAKVVVEVSAVPMMKRHTSPNAGSKRENQRARGVNVDGEPVYPDLYICSILPLVIDEKPCLFHTSYHIYTEIRTSSKVGCTSRKCLSPRPLKWITSSRRGGGGRGVEWGRLRRPRPVHLLASFPPPILGDASVPPFSTPRPPLRTWLTYNAALFQTHNPFQLSLHFALTTGSSAYALSEYPVKSTD